MVPRTKSSLLWGVVGVLAFLAAAQAYQLVVASLGVGLPTLVGIAVVVGTVVTVVSYVAEYRLTSKGRT